MVSCLNVKYFLFVTIGMSLCFTTLAQEPWVIPENEQTVVAPFIFDSLAVSKGEQLFMNNCKSCHGMPGSGTNVPMTPLARDPLDSVYQSNSDGSMFYKITQGRLPMPAFKNSLTVKERWIIVAYIRSFNPDYVQPEPVKSKFEGLDILVSYGEDKNLINVNLKQQLDGKNIAVKDFEVDVFAKRYFGEIQIDKSKVTDSLGGASFVFPSDLPGDSAGNIKLVVKASDARGSVSFSEDTLMQIGAASKHFNILDQRSWWNVRSKAPVWLILTYSLTVLVVFSFLLYIIYLIYKMKEAGKSNN